MAARPTKLVIDCTTGEEQVIELTDEEILDMENRAARAEEEKTQQNAIAEAKAIAKASAEAKLAALGLTAEEIAAL
jgi:hypothetical protein